jgi:hypothetical protein
MIKKRLRGKLESKRPAVGGGYGRPSKDGLATGGGVSPILRNSLGGGVAASVKSGAGRRMRCSCEEIDSPTEPPQKV